MLNEPQASPSPWQLAAALNQCVQQLQCRLNEQQALIDRLCKQVAALNERVNAVENKPYYHVDTIQYHFDQLKVEKLDGTLNIGMSAPSEEQIKEVGQLVIPGPGNGHGNGHGNPTGTGIGNGNGNWNGNGNGNGSFVVNEPKQPAPTKSDPQATNKVHQFPSASSTGTPEVAQPAPPYPEIRAIIDRHLDMVAPQRLQQLEAELGTPLDPYHRKLVIEDIRKQTSARIQYYITTVSRDSKNDEHKDGNAETFLRDEVVRKTMRDIDKALQNYLNRLPGSANNEESR